MLSELAEWSDSLNTKISFSQPQPSAFLTIGAAMSAIA
eukprot:COSAG04_NODE_688_length_11148_cov_2.882071_2_plen_38_part_00